MIGAFLCACRELADLRRRNAEQQRIIENSHQNNDALRAEIRSLLRVNRAQRMALARQSGAIRSLLARLHSTSVAA